MRTIKLRARFLLPNKQKKKKKEQLLVSKAIDVEDSTILYVFRIRNDCDNTDKEREFDLLCLKNDVQNSDVNGNIDDDDNNSNNDNNNNFDCEDNVNDNDAVKNRATNSSSSTSTKTTTLETKSKDSKEQVQSISRTHVIVKFNNNLLRVN